ncbi:TonB-dependent receptor [Butyricimonas virosa]|uniref:TonB-dependent receptor n=1 Tax=Butyricimonas virosa TaxID=544645 RepID=UPI000E44BA4B|nr:TonB-dependent receptor [Butyricimonas virosa]RGL90767.1 SusC/RagA family TonB-linked outer membrane protein [Butyricimonas virosa]
MKKSLLFRNGGGSFCKICLLVCLLAIGFTNLNAQNAVSKKVSLDFKNVPLIDVLLEIQKQTGVNFAYEKTQVEQLKPVTINVKNATVEDVLKTILKDTGFTYKITGDNIAIVKIQEKNVSNFITVRGTVVDEKGNPIPGATIVIHGTTQGVASDMEGRYSLPVNPDDVLKITFVGYKDEIVPVKGKTKIDVRLSPTIESLEEVQVVAFGEQKKESVVSAITTVRAESLKSSNSDLTASFAGKIAGIVGWQTGGIPGALTEEEMNTKFYIRGITSFQTGANIDPLILLDGVESSKLDLARIDPEDIESFSVLKDASATAMYGARGANGVILVTTKKGQEGSVYTSVRYEAIATMPTREIDVVDPITWMKMYNQAQVGRNPDVTPKYSMERINRTGSKKYPSWVYPANDWYGIMFKNMSVNHHMGVNIRGGSKLVQYYASINHNRDQGMLKTDRLNEFDCNIKNNNTTFRVNLNIDLSKGIKLLINSFSTLDNYHGPVQDVTQAYYLAFKANPIDFAPTYPADLKSSWPHIRFGGSQDSQNPYALLHKGYRERSRYSSINRMEYIQNLSSLLKGLEFRGSVSMTKSGYYSTDFVTTPYSYSLVSYDESTGTHELQLLNPSLADRTLKIDDETRISTATTQMTYDLRVLHTAAWRDHSTSFTAVFNALESTTAPVFSVLNGVKHRNLGLSMRLAYGFKDRYFAEASFGYNGSERFAKQNRMGFFPAAGVAWIASKENFMLPVSRWLSFLKFRASYGKVGNDGIINEPRFVFLPNIVDKLINSPRPNEGLTYAYNILAYENKDIQWEIAEQVNLGMELKLLDGIIDLTVDAYQEIRHNVLANRTVVPSSVGLGLQPLDNVGKVKSRGIDLSGKIQHAFSPDFWVIFNGTLTFNKATFMEIEEASNKTDYQVKKGHEISQQVGYIAEGLFRDEVEIANAPVQGGNVMPGDIRYRDLNGDGVIDVNDVTYIGYPETPRLIYGFSGFVNYKGFEFSFTFQGSGRRAFFMNPVMISPFYGNNAMLTAIYKDHWTPDNMKNNPLWPRLSTNNIGEITPQEDWYGIFGTANKEIRKSTYFMREGKFLRCQSLELAYNLPKKWSTKIALSNLKVFVRANNPFIISDFKIWDVELGSDGFNYPIQKTYSVGLNVSF